MNIVRSRYEQMKIEPPFDALPLEDNGAKKSKRS